MKKQRFTLIELLTVIAIIAILMGLLLPVLGKIKEAGKKTKAKAQMKGLELAIKSYESTYGVLPNLLGETVETWPLGDSTDSSYTSHITGYSGTAYSSNQAYDILLQVLTKVNLPASVAGTADTKSTMGNARNIPFMEAPSKFISDGFLDPFTTTANPKGNRYVIKIDFDYDNKVTVDGVDVYGSVAIYSFGVDGKSSTPEEKKDDIKSWEQ